MDITEIHSDDRPAQRPADPRLSRADRVLLALALLALLATALLGNPPPPTRDWPAGSLLQHIVAAVSLEYRLPTLRGIEAKTLLVSLLSGILLVWATVRLASGTLLLAHDLPNAPGATAHRAQAATLSLAAVFLLILWSLVSALWSRSPAVAAGSIWVLSLGWLWAAGLALHGHRRLVRPLTDILLVAATLTAILSLWYWHARATEIRLGWPLGNPLSLASVMVPTVLLAAGRLAEQIAHWSASTQRPRTAARAALYAAITALTLTTLLATGSRGPLLAVLIGLAAAIWVALSRQRRIALGLAGVVLLALATPSAFDWLFTAAGGRDASARMRVYAWRDALQLAWNKPAAGHGAGAFSLLSTSLSAPDCLVDPLAMSGQVSSHAHCEPLELLADLGVFGALLGVAIWGFAATAAAGRAAGPDRWLAAALAGAVVAAFVDASTGVSWRLPGPAPFLAMPVALTWMLCRQPASATPSAPLHRPLITWLPAILGLAVAFAGIADFAAARFLYRSQAAMQQAQRTLAARRTDADTRPQIAILAAYATRQADLAARWQMDPPRKLVALLAAGQLRATLAYLPQPSAAADSPTSQHILETGLTILQYLAALTRLTPTAAGYADTDWRIAEQLNAIAGLAAQAHADTQAAQYRQQALSLVLQYFATRPLDREAIWQAMSVWPELPPAQRLSLLRGTLRDEGEVWRQQSAAVPGYLRWTQQQGYVFRMWHLLADQADSVQVTFVEAGYSALHQPYRHWQDPLAPEGLRLAAGRLLLQGRPDQAADLLNLAILLYDRSAGLLPYSHAATWLDLAACRLRQAPNDALWAQAALLQALAILRPLPANPVHTQLLDLADSLHQAIAAVAATTPAPSADACYAAVDLFWDMPAAQWPAPIDSWAHRADAAAAQGMAGGVTLQLLIGRGDAPAARAHLQQQLAQGASKPALQTALRQAGYRWPSRQPLATDLIHQLTATSQPTN